MIRVDLTQVLHTPELNAAYETLTNKRPLMAAVGKRLEKDLRGHFAQRDQEPNKRGWKKLHFWSQRVRAKTSLTQATETMAEVEIASREFLLRLHGGVVVPREKKFLALPAVEEAYGRSPRTFDNLRFGIDPDMGPVLEDKSTGAAFYFLRRRTTHKPDPRALPTKEQITTAVSDEASRFFERRRARAQAVQLPN